MDELIKLPSTLDFERLSGIEKPKSPDSSYPDVNYKQLMAFLGDSKLRNKLKQLGKDINVSSTGGYNDFYLNFLQETFDIKIKKTRMFFSYVISAIDFLNKNTEDCFFDLPGQDTSLLFCVGESKFWIE